MAIEIHCRAPTIVRQATGGDIMAAIYDLALKFEGLGAFCNVNVSPTTLGSVLYHDLLGEQAQREAISKVKKGERLLSTQDRMRLSDYFNAAFARLARSNEPIGAQIRPEDWDRPFTDFFADAFRGLQAPDDALDRAHAAIVLQLNSFDEFRSRTTPLGLLRHVGQSRDRARFPTAAAPVDTVTLPIMSFAYGDAMTIGLAQPLAEPSFGWMFFVRNPDCRGFRIANPDRIWNQKAGDVVRWAQSPLPLDQGFFGPLPGYPSQVEKIDGEYTAYLLVEPRDTSPVTRFLQQTNRHWGTSTPSLDATIQLLSRPQTLFKLSEGGFSPLLLTRRYRIPGC